ncbi:hypothetical protein D1007_62427 [Hordeum vulgare]|nr:hypothetical protein D1007_62427 [Hordeum vulgare]
MVREDRKRRQPNDEAADEGERRGRRDKRPKEEKPAPPLPSEIRNKEKRSEVYAKLKREKKAQKRRLGRNDADEFNAVLKQVVTPKLLITTCRFNSGRGPAFIKELMQVIPNAQYVNRGTYDLKKIVEYANNREFTSVMVVHTNRREPDALLIINLPEGPTAHFKLSKLVLRKDIKCIVLD